MDETVPRNPPRQGQDRPPSGFADLWWIPVGAGGHFVVYASGLWERMCAMRNRRAARRLFHAALEIHVGDDHLLVEMAPAWGAHSGSHGIVKTGPVGIRILGRSRLFRYEVRCREDGSLPDREYAPEAPTRMEFTLGSAEQVRECLLLVPGHVWGRDALGVGDMWNSNSLIAWLLVSAGCDVRGIHPPAGGEAPGWAAGIAAAKN